MIGRIKPARGLEADGGIDIGTVPLVVEAGADIVVAGTAIFGESFSITAAFGRLRAAISELTERVSCNWR
jgi:ribulose-phosphate 3-epimerase